MRILSCLATAICLSCAPQAKGTGTNVVTFPNAEDFRYIMENPIRSDSFVARFGRQIGLKANPVAIDTFGYPVSTVWAYQLERGGYEIHKKVTDAGTRVFKDTLLYGMREASVEMSLVQELEDWGTRTGYTVLGPISRIFVGSIGNTSEEQIEGVGSTPSVTTTERAMERFQGENVNSGFSYGIRPFRTSPYLYLTTDIGHYAGRPAVISHTRFYSMLEHKGVMNLEQQFTVPISDRFYIAGGVSFYPTAFREKRPVCSGTVQYLFGRHTSEKIFYMSLVSSQEGSFVLGGLSVAF